MEHGFDVSVFERKQESEMMAIKTKTSTRTTTENVNTLFLLAKSIYISISLYISTLSFKIPPSQHVLNIVGAQ